jgi:hypothetical protein
MSAKEVLTPVSEILDIFLISVTSSFLSHLARYGPIPALPSEVTSKGVAGGAVGGALARFPKVSRRGDCTWHPNHMASA